MNTQDTRVGTFIAGKYEVLSILGRGGLGVVYKAKQKHLERMCAVKILSEKFSEDPTSFQRFEREARIASSLNNDNIISVFDFGLADEGYAYLVMEYVEGEDLDTILRRQGRVEPARAIPLFLCVTTALTFAHAKSVVHRDLKPSNVMISTDENGQELVKLVDFGMAKSFSEVKDNDEQLTAEGRVLGTPAYMSPEQCLGRPVDARTDIYAMGALMYKVITGFPPFTGGSVYSVMTSHVSEPPQPISVVAPELEVGDLERAIMKCLEKEPDKRYQNAMELRADLEMALVACWSKAGRQSTETSSTVLTVVPENMGDFESTHRAAEKGDPTAQYQLALVFRDGTLVGQDDFEYVKWLKKAAEGGNALAMNDLGIAYEYGPADYDMSQARLWYRKAAENGVASAMCDVACFFENDNDLEEAVKWFRKSAEAGFSIGQSNYARCLYYGLGVPKNYPEALKWMDTALMNDPNNESALYMKGFCYLEGHGLKADSKKAAELFRKSADLNNGRACIELARLYTMGDGVEQDHDEAKSLLILAIEFGMDWAKEDLARLEAGRLEKSLDPVSVENWLWYTDFNLMSKAESQLIEVMATPDRQERNSDDRNTRIREIISELFLLAEAGHELGTLLLARCYEAGVGVPQDLNRAQELYRTVYDGGCDLAEPLLIGCYMTCFEDHFFPELAKDFLLDAAQRRNPHAMVCLATYYRGLNPDGRDHASALFWYRKAAEIGDRDAQYTLGRFLVMKNRHRRQRQGAVIRWWDDSVDRDLDPASVDSFDDDVYNTERVEALRWLGMAADEGSCDALILLSALHNQNFLVVGNKEEAKRLLTRAAELDDRRAQALLGVALLTRELPGHGKETDAKAIELLEVSATAGDQFAQWNLAIELIEGTRVAENKLRAKELLEEAAQGLFPQDRVWSTDGFKERFAGIARLFEDLATKGQREARYWWGLCLENMIGGVGKDRDKSMLLYLKSAEQGYEPARQRFEQAPANLQMLARKKFLNELL